MTAPERQPWDPPVAAPLTAKTRTAVLAELRDLAALPSGRAWRMEDLLHLYREGLPSLPIARDPYSDEVVSYAVDTFGLDGPWWDYHAPVRPADQLPPSLFSLTGAMQLAVAVPMFTHLAKVGPAVPFVVPRLLAHEQVTAVLSSLDVGGNTAWIVSYFADPPLLDHHRFNTWGTNRYWWRDAGGDWRWNDCTEDAEILDVDLAPWIESGRLRWVAPGDQDAVLRDTVRHCPYVGIEGTPELQRVSQGKVWMQSGAAPRPARRRRTRS